MISTYEKFESVSDEHGRFDSVNKLSSRRDVHVIMLLDKLFPGTHCMLSYVGHDEIWLSILSEDIDKLSDGHILELVRCGIRYCKDSKSLVLVV